jgi:hypothetical protein
MDVVTNTIFIITTMKGKKTQPLITIFLVWEFQSVMTNVFIIIG